MTRYVWVAARKRRGVLDGCGVRCRRREPPGVLRLAGPPTGGAANRRGRWRLSGLRPSWWPRCARSTPTRAVRTGLRGWPRSCAGGAGASTTSASSGSCDTTAFAASTSAAELGWRRDSAAQQAPPDLVRRRFRPGRPDRAWAGDITFVPTAEGWLYLAAVLDVGSRRLVGYSMAADMPARPVIDALDTAAASRGHSTAGVIFHSDRGSQAGFNRWSQHLDDGGVRWRR